MQIRCRESWLKFCILEIRIKIRNKSSRTELRILMWFLQVHRRNRASLRKTSQVCWNQCFIFESELDTDSNGLMDTDPDRESESGFQQTCRQKRKNEVISCLKSSLLGQSVSWELNVLRKGLKKTYMTFFDLKKKSFCLDSYLATAWIRIRMQQNAWIRIRIQWIQISITGCNSRKILGTRQKVANNTANAGWHNNTGQKETEIKISWYKSRTFMTLVLFPLGSHQK
jgi:hypothetical protein